MTSGGSDTATSPQPSQTWRHKRERWRTVFIRDVYADGLNVPRVDVRRNTSRRRQSIKVATLLREYELVTTE